MTTTSRMNDQQRGILEAAAANEGGHVFPLPGGEALSPGRKRSLTALLKRGLLEERAIGVNGVDGEEPQAWREENGAAFALILSKAGRAAIGAGGTAQPAAEEAAQSDGADDSESTPVTEPAAPTRGDTKKEAVLALLRRDDGANLGEIEAATGWQRHSVRGFLSGTVKKKLGLTLEQRFDEVRGRVYQLVVESR